MKNLIWVPLIIFLMSFSCEDSQDILVVDLDQLEELENQIVTLSESIACTNSEEWKFTPMGSKACGGPVRYIAYHQSIENDFLKLVEEYTFQQDQFNRANNIVSDCMLIVSPRTVTCEGNKPVLVY
jgi:hypothetical protein